MASHQSVSVYTAGGTLVVTNAFVYSGQLWSLLWRPHLPGGWGLTAVSGDGNPELSGGEILWTGVLPPSPIRLTYTVMVPPGATEDQQIRGEVEYQFAGAANPTNQFAGPDPLSVESAGGPGVVQTTSGRYVAGATLTVTNAFSYTNALWSLLWRPHVPDGWSLGTVAGDGNPELNGGDIVWPGALPPSPIVMTYTLQVPIAAAGTGQILGEVEYQFAGMVNPATRYAHPHPLTVEPQWAPPVGTGLATHQTSAQYMPGAELRVTNTFTCTDPLWSLLWRPQLPSGWSLGTASGDGEPEISGGEILWTGTLPPSPITMVYTVIVPVESAGDQQIRSEVEYQLAGTVNPTNGPVKPDPLTVQIQGGPVVTHLCPTQAVAGTTFSVTNTFAYTNTLWSLLWRPRLPAGWVLEAASGDGDPELKDGEIVWTGQLPPSPIRMVYVVLLPAEAAGTQSLRAEVEYQFAGMANPATRLATPTPLTVHLLENPVAPSIVMQPFDRIASVGGNVTFAVLASGTEPLNYQWSRNGTNLVDGGRISGATAASLSLTNLQTVDAGSYQVVVANALGAATSQVATLTVQVQLRPDLWVTQVAAPALGWPGQPIEVAWCVTNRGQSEAAGPWNDSVLLAASADGQDAQVLGFLTCSNRLAAGSSYTRTQQVVLPPFACGQYWVAVRSDSANSVVEESETNNIATAPQAIVLPPVLSLSLSVTSLVENAGSNAATAVLSRNGDIGQPLSVTLECSGTNRLRVPGAVSIPAGEYSVAFPIHTRDNAIAGETTNVWLTATAPGYTNAIAWLTLIDDDLPALTLMVDRYSFSEGAGATAATATVSRNTETGASLTVNLLSDDPSEARVPASVVIPAGQSSVSFPIAAIDDKVLDGTQRVVLSALASGHASASAMLQVVDDEVLALTLTVALTNLSEGAVNPATLGTITRSLVGTNSLSVVLTSSDTTTVTVPGEAIIPGGQAGTTFPINVVDDGLANGTRVVTLLGRVVGPDGVVTDEGSATATVRVTDDDGPTLSLHLSSSLIREGETAQATITRNTPTGTNLVANLVSSDLTEISLPATVTIPAGQSAAEFSVAAISDGITDGLQSVTITASAPGFNESSVLVQTTDIDLPDLAVAAITPGSATGFVGDALTLTWTVTNAGLASASGPWIESVFLSDDSRVGNDTWVTNLTCAGSLAVGQFCTQAAALRLPATAGQYWIVVSTDATNAVAEGVEWNNTRITAEPIEVNPTYRASVETDVTLAPAGTPVPLHGHAFLPATLTPVPLQPVTVRIRVRDTRRILNVVTDQNGNFDTVFDPLPTEAGQYTVCADHPGVTEDTVQDTFVLVGLWASPSALSLRLIPHEPVSGTIELRNLGDVALTGIAAVLSNAPANLTAQFDTPATLAASATNLLQYRVEASTASPAGASCSLRVTTAEGAVLDLPVDVQVAPLFPNLVANPETLAEGMVRGEQTIVSFVVSNTGGAASGDLTVTLPDAAWMTMVSTNQILSLAPGQTATVTLALRPPADLPLAQYQGAIGVGNQDLQLTVPFTFTAISSAVGDLAVTVVDDYTYYVAGAPKVAGARVRLRDAFDSTRILAEGTSDSTGLAHFSALAEGVYLLEVAAEHHDTVRESCTVHAGITNAVEVFLPRQLISYRWVVTPTGVADHYQITIETVFEAEAPVPVVTIEAPSAVDGPALGESVQIDVTLTNRGLLAAQEVTFTALETASYVAHPLISEIGTLAAHSAVTIPVTIERKPGTTIGGGRKDTSSDSAGEGLALSGRSHTPCGGRKVSHTALAYCSVRHPGGHRGGGEPWSFIGWVKSVFGRFRSQQPEKPQPSPGGIRGYIDVRTPNLMASEHSCRYGGAAAAGVALGGFNPASVIDAFSTSTIPARTKKGGKDAGSNICARVTLHLDQDAVLTRSAFEGTLEIDNDNASLSILGVRLALDIRDTNNVSANDRFFTSAPELEILTGIDGSGSVAPQETGSARFLFVPAVTAATNGPTDYAIGGTLRYLDPESGQEVIVPIFPALITVYPDASLRLRYFHQRDVYSDDPTTDEIEPAEPFALGLLVQNSGLGTARSFQLTSAQPRIVDNEKGLLIDFRLVGSQVGTQSFSPSLTLALGDIAPGHCEVARWDFVSSLQGKFLSYEAQFQHADDLGGLRTSMIDRTEIHELVHVVQADRTGDDAMMDFLVNDEPDPDNLPDALYLSDGTTAAVNLASGVALDSTPEADHLQVALTAQVVPGWVYLQVTNPSPDLRLAALTRSDGKSILLGSNAWMTDRSFPAALTGVRREYLLHVLDYDSTGAYTLQFVPASSTNTAPVLAQLADQTVMALSTLTVTNLALDADVPANTLTFGLVSAPAGVSLDPVTGVLTWTPSEAQSPSTNQITVQVADNGVPPLSDRMTFTVVVIARPIAPAITVEPQSRTNLAGTTATFAVLATGTPPLAYQWFQNGTRLADGDRVSGATNSTLTLLNVAEADAADYQVVVTNLAGSATSVVAQLTVTVPSTNLDSGLLAYYPFDEDANDHSGHPAANLTNFGAVPAPVEHGGCFYFAAGTYTYHPDFNLTRVPLSMSLWFKARSIQPVGSKLISNWGFTQNGAYRGFRLVQESGNYLALAVGPSPNQNQYPSLGGYETNRWYHLAACFDTNGVSAYVDGALALHLNLTLSNRSADVKMWIGGRGTSADDWWGDFDGWIDEVRIYDRLLSTVEVQWLAQRSGTVQPGAKRWEFAAGAEVGGSPALGADGTVYVGSDDGKMYALEGATGSKRWDFQTGGFVFSSPAIGPDGTVYFGSFDHRIYALDGADGSKRWEYLTGDLVTSSPAIGSNGTVYVGSYDGNLYALSGTTGQKQWAFATGGGISSSPAVGSGGTVYFGSLDQKVYALDGVTGAKRWEYATGNQVHSSPAIGADGTVYIGSYDRNVYALNGANGALCWTFTAGEYIWCGPTIGPDGTVYTGAHDGNVYALDGATGQQRWVRYVGGYVGPSPALGGDGVLYVGSGPNGKFSALDSATGQVLWQFTAGSDVSSSAVLAPDGTVYVGSHDHKVYAFYTSSTGGLADGTWPMFRQNPRHTGRAVSALPTIPVITTQPASQTVSAGTNVSFSVTAVGATPLAYQWRLGVTNLADATNTSLTLTNVSLLNAGDYSVVITNVFGAVTSQTAILTVLAPPSPPGTKIWEYSVAAEVNSSPALGPGGILCFGSADGHVYAVNTADGSGRWVFDAQAMVQSSPAIGADGTVYVGADNGKVFAFNGTDGTKLWEFGTGGMVQCAPAIGADGTVYVGSFDNKLYALEGAAGTERWRYATGGAICGSPALGLNGLIYTVSHDGWVYALEQETGTLRWRFDRGQTGSWEDASPALGGDGTVYVGSKNGKVFALDGATGQKLWEYLTGGAVVSTPALGNDGLVYIGSDDGKVYALNWATGARQWETSVGHWGMSSVAIGVDGTLYIASRGSGLSALDAQTGQVRWQFNKDGSDSSPVIGPDGVVYVGGGGRPARVFALASASVGGLADSAWPMFHQNARHTGMTPLPVLAPVVLTQPQSQTVYVGYEARFTVASRGTGLGFQWQKDQTPIAGATAAALTLSNVQFSSAGNYRVVVSNAIGSATSSAVLLTVIPLPAPPVIQVQPVSQTVVLGNPGVFRVSAVGEGHLTYRWRKDAMPLSDGGRISGVQTTNLSLSRVLVSDAGSYVVEVANEGGTTPSQPALLTVDTSQAVPGTELWEYSVAAEINSSPALGPDGTLCFGSADGHVYAVDAATGSGRWVFNAQALVQSSPAIARDGTVYIGADNGRVYALEGTDGTKLWEFGTGGMVQCAPAIGADGTVYVGSFDNKLYALEGATGAERWRYATGGAICGSPALGLNGLVYTVAHDGWVYALEQGTGTLRWRFDRGLTGNWEDASPALDGDGTVYVGSRNGKVFALDGATGQELWEYLTGGEVVCTPTLGNNGMVYVGSDDGKVYALNSTNGVKRWETAVAHRGMSSAALGADGTLYIASRSSWLSALDALSGQVQWQYNKDGSDSSPVIGPDGRVYVGGGGRPAKMYALASASVGGLADTAWPMFHQNARHTGRVEAPSTMPAIVTHPQSRTNLVGTTAGFTVVATGADPLGYQWLKNGAFLSEGGRLSGASGTNLTIADVQPADGGDYQVAVTNRFGSVTSRVATLTVIPSVTIAGVGHDGYVAEGTVFFDANRNGVRDGNEPVTTTDHQGQFQLAVPLAPFDANGNGQLDPAEGCLVLTGGLDIATGQPLRSTLTAPACATVVNPLTTLLQEVLDQAPGLSVSNAQQRVQTALGISNRVDLTAYNPFVAAGTNDPLAVPVLSAGARLQDTTVQIAALIEGASASLSSDEAARLVTATLAVRLSTDADALLALGSLPAVQAVVTQAIANATLTLDPSIAAGAAQVIAAGNQLKDQAAGAATNSLQAAQEISRIQGLAQGAIAADLASVAADDKTIDDVLVNDSGAGLASLVATAPVGDVTGQELRPGTFAFSQPDFRVLEDGTPIVPVTVVRTDGNRLAVGLRIVLGDGTARMGDGDYVATNLDLLFVDGQISQSADLAPLLADDSRVETNETIQLTLTLLPGAPAQALLGAQNQAVLTIVDNDSPGTFAFTEGTYQARENGTAVSPVTIRRDGGSAGEVSLIVTPAAISGGATPVADFDPAPVMVTFLAGNMNRIVSIPIVADSVIEGDELLQLSLALAPGAPPGAALGTRTSTTLTILDSTMAEPRIELGLLPPGAGGEFRFSLSGTAGRRCLVQQSSNLVDWTDLSSAVLVDTPLVITGVPMQSASRRFYRALLLP